MVKYTVLMLRDLAKKKNIKGISRMNKSDLMTTLGISYSKTSTAGRAQATPKNTIKNCNEFLIKELYTMAKEKDIYRRSAMNKAKLCDALHIPVILSDGKRLLIKKSAPDSKKSSIKIPVSKKSTTKSPKKSTGKIPSSKKTTPKTKSPKKSERSDASKKLSSNKNNKERACVSASKMKLRDYQTRPIHYLLNPKNKGIVVAFGVGVGKTITAVTAIECLLKQNTDWVAIIITPTSLQENFRNGMSDYGTSKTDKRYLFYTPTTYANLYDYPAIIKSRGSKVRTLSQQKTDKLNLQEHTKLMEILDSGKFMLVVDEAHNFKTNLHPIISFGGEKDGTRAEILIKSAQKASKVLLLTATPLYNELIDVVNLMAMVRQEKELTEEEFDILIGYNKSMSEASIPDFINKLNNNKEAKRYFGCLFDFHYRDDGDTNYPKVKYHNVDVVMDKDYYIKYRLEEVKMGKKAKKKGVAKALDEGESKAFYTNLRAAAIKFKPNPKIKAVVEKIKEGRKTLVYSSFLDWGIDKIKEALPKSTVTHSYTITGSVPKNKRQQIVDDFNSNTSGYNLLFITKAGGEGLDLKGVRTVIIFERNWNKGIEEQVIGRAVRYKSHAHLSPKDQIVDVFYYDLRKLSKPQRIEAIDKYNNTAIIRLNIEEDSLVQNDKGILTVDEIMRNLGTLKDKKIKAFITWLRSISISTKYCNGLINI